MKLKLTFVVEVVFLSIVFFLVNIRSLIVWNMFPETGDLYGEAWREVFIWLMALLMMFYLLRERKLIEKYLTIWLNNPLLLAFVLFSLVSVLWSHSWTVTLHRSLTFLFATLAAVFLGLGYTRSEFLRILRWIGGVVILSSFVLALAVPNLGTDLNPGYEGAWRGIFWHKNQLGNILPLLNAIFLLDFFSSGRDRKSCSKWLSAIFYVLSLIDILFAESASGYIVTIVLHMTFGVAFLWLKVKHLLRPVHYYIVLVVFVAVCAGVLLNLDFVLGLFGREMNLTGRIPMWDILFREVFPQSPWFGQGFGTTWSDLDFRLYMRDSAGWPYPIMIGDNGFIDILLNLGLVGLVLFLLYYIQVWINSVRYFLQEASLEGFSPFIFMVYTFFVNLTFSLFMETEVFVWTLMVALGIITLRKGKELISEQPSR